MSRGDITDRARILLDRLDKDPATSSGMDEPKVKPWDTSTLRKLLDAISRTRSATDLYFPASTFHPGPPIRARFETEHEYEQAVVAWEHDWNRRRVLSLQFCLLFQRDKLAAQARQHGGCAIGPDWDTSGWDPVWQQVELLKRTAIRVGSERGAYLGSATSIAEIRDPRLRIELEKRCPLYFEVCNLIRRVDPLPLSPELGKSRLDLLREAGIDVKPLLDDAPLVCDSLDHPAAPLAESDSATASLVSAIATNLAEGPASKAPAAAATKAAAAAADSAAMTEPTTAGAAAGTAAAATTAAATTAVATTAAVTTPGVSTPGSHITATVVPSVRSASDDTRASKRPRLASRVSSSFEGQVVRESPGLSGGQLPTVQAAAPISQTGIPSVAANGGAPVAEHVPCASSTSLPLPPAVPPATPPREPLVPCPSPPPSSAPCSPIKPVVAARPAQLAPPSPPPTASGTGSAAGPATSAPQTGVEPVAAGHNVGLGMKKEEAVVKDGPGGRDLPNGPVDGLIDFTAEDSDSDSDDDIWEFVPIGSSRPLPARPLAAASRGSRASTRPGGKSTNEASRRIDLTEEDTTDESDEDDIWEIVPVESPTAATGADRERVSVPPAGDIAERIGGAEHRGEDRVDEQDLVREQNPVGERALVCGQANVPSDVLIEPIARDQREEREVRDFVQAQSPRQASPTTSAESMDIIPPTPGQSEHGPVLPGSATDGRGQNGGSPTRTNESTRIGEGFAVPQNEPAPPASLEPRADSHFESNPPPQMDSGVGRSGAVYRVRDRGWSQRRPQSSSRATSVAPPAPEPEWRQRPSYPMARSFSGPGRPSGSWTNPGSNPSGRPRDGPLRRTASYTHRAALPPQRPIPESQPMSLHRPARSLADRLAPAPPARLQQQMIDDLEAAIAPTFSRSWLTPTDRREFEAPFTTDGQRDEIISQARNSLVLDALAKSYDVAVLLRDGPISSRAFVVPHRRGRMVMTSALRQLIRKADGEAFENVADVATAFSRQLQHGDITEIVFSRPDVFAAITPTWPIRDHRVVFVDDFLRGCAEDALRTLRSDRP